MWRLYQSLRWLWGLWGTFIVGGLGIALAGDCLSDWLFKGKNCTVNQAVQNSLPTYGPWVLAFLLLFLGLTLWARRDYHRREALNEARERHRKANESFALLKSADQLRPEDLNFQIPESGQGLAQDKRPFYSIYVPREAAEVGSDTARHNEEALTQSLRDGKGFILLGPPMDGKSRTLYEIVSNMDGYSLLMAREAKQAPDDDAFSLLLEGRRVVLIVDDLPRYLGRGLDLDEFCRKLGRYARSWVIASTCRDGPELRTVQTSLRTFYEEIRLKLRLLPPTAEEKGLLAASIHKKWDPEASAEYPTLGSITMEDHMSAMKVRFDRLLDENPEQADTLRALRLLASAGVLPFTHERLDAVLTNIFRRQNIHILDCLRALARQAFLQGGIAEDPVQPEPAYLRDAVTYTEGKDPKDDFAELANVMENLGDHEGLVALGRTYELFLGDSQHALACMDRAINLRGDSVEARFAKTWILTSLGRHQEALDAIEAIHDLAPDSPEALMSMGDLLNTMGRYQYALDAVEGGLAHDPDSPEMLTIKSMALLGLNRPQEALDSATEALNHEPTLPVSWMVPRIAMLKAIALNVLGRPQEALESSEEVLRFWPDLPQAWNLKSASLLRLGRSEEAMAAFEKSVGSVKAGDSTTPLQAADTNAGGDALASFVQPHKLMEALTEAINPKADSAEALITKAGALMALGQFEDALSMSKRALELKPDLMTAHLAVASALNAIGQYEESLEASEEALSRSPNSVLALVVKSEALVRLDRPQEALEAAEEILRFAPNSWQAFLIKSFALIAMGQYEEALESSREVVSRSPEQPDGWANMGAALAYVGQYEEAIDASDKALDLWPNHYIALLNKSGALNGLERFEEALEAVERALSLWPGFPEARRLKVGILLSLERDEEALEALNETLEIAPDDPEGWTIKGHVLEDLERPEEALESYDRALSLGSSDSEIWWRKSFILIDLERYEDALDALDKVSNMEPEVPDTWYVMGVVLAELERYQRAVEAYDRALGLRPEDPNVWYAKGLAIGRLGRNDEGIEWLCRAWRAREDLSDEDVTELEVTLRELGHEPQKCE